jgi:uncharacterized protein GlcG (DUF336 family)
MRARGATSLLAASALLLGSCGGGGSSSGGGGSPAPGPAPAPAPSSSYAVPAQVALTSAEVGQIVAQAVAQADSLSRPATLAVVDRVGNVLAVFRMTGAGTTVKIPDAPNGANADVQGLTVPAEAAAIAKAITGAYLSSGGNAFSTRTASMIVQPHFPPAPTTAGLESGPLFGVQFSQLPCSDLSARLGGAGGAMIGPKRSPLGLAADPGGFPLYKNGVLVGGVGAIADGSYALDADVLDLDSDSDELIALAGTVGFAAPEDIRAERIFVDGTALRFSDAGYGALANVAGAMFAAADARGDLVPVTGYYPVATLLSGAAYGSEASGVRASTAAEFANRDAFVLSDGAGSGRYPIRAGTDAGDVPQPLTAAEARAILEDAFAVMTRARAQIRRPLDSRAQVTISLVDTRGQVLGLVRSPDAPVFGIDVSLQKARTANFMSGPFAAAQLAGAGGEMPHFLANARAFLGAGALTGATAFTDRAGGNLSRPYFPDGELGRSPGPFSRPIAQFSPFSTGLQSALVLGNLAQHLAFVTGASPSDTPQRCTSLPEVAPGQNRLANGMQVFPGSVPVYRGSQLVGGLGVSGDGIDQDDMISFLGTHNAGTRLGGFGNAPAAMRADQVAIDLSGRQVRLRYVGCPFAPFLDTTQQNVCQGL